jgi:hypothetical protein
MPNCKRPKPVHGTNKKSSSSKRSSHSVSRRFDDPTELGFQDAFEKPLSIVDDADEDRDEEQGQSPFCLQLDQRNSRKQTTKIASTMSPS